jgi:Zn finger protein HypA/HybF involved in hydrogenase expression
MVIYIDPKPKPVKLKCKDCGKEFEQKARARYPRKYCDKCSAKRKKDYDDLWKVKAHECEDA